MEEEIEIFCAFNIEKNITGFESPDVNNNASDTTQINSSLLYLDPENANTQDKSFNIFQLVKGCLLTPFISGSY